MIKNICPYCDTPLGNKITKKQRCPKCEMEIYVRSGNLVTEDEASTLDWLEDLSANFGIGRERFENERTKLSKRFGKRASAHDTVWKILNELLIRYSSDNSKLATVHQLMASLVSQEDRDPTDRLVEEAKARNIANFEFTKEILEGKKALALSGYSSDEYDLASIDEDMKILTLEEVDEEKLVETKLLFLGHEELAYIRRLSKEGKFGQAEKLLYKSQPSPAVLDEIRKICSKKARIAKENGDWVDVIRYLEDYINYANTWREFCINFVNQAPLEHTDRDKRLLLEAEDKFKHNTSKLQN